MSGNESDDIFGEIEKNYNSGEEDDLHSDRRRKADASTTVDENGAKKPLGQQKTRKLVRGVQLKLDPNRIGGPRGITAVAKSFQDVKLRGKNYEKQDLEIVLAKMEHWAHRLFPKLPFDDCVEQIAKLGNNRLVQVHMKRFRMEMSRTDSENEDDDATTNEVLETTYKPPDNSDVFEAIMAKSVVTPAITQDQQNRMAENKRKAEEKRKSRLLLNTSQPSLEPSSMECSIADTEPEVEGVALEPVEVEDDVLDVDMFLENLPFGI